MLDKQINKAIERGGTLLGSTLAALLRGLKFLSATLLGKQKKIHDKYEYFRYTCKLLKNVASWF